MCSEMTAVQSYKKSWRSSAERRRAAWLAALLVSLAQARPAAATGLETVAGALESEVTAVAQPVAETVVDVVSTQCDTVKKIFGISYDQVEAEDEPDLSQLTLEFTDPEVTIVYNISVAAEYIPRARRFAPGQRLYLLVHGFNADPSSDTITSMRDALLAQSQSNVLALDASSLTDSMYLRASTYVRFIGDKLGEVLGALVDNGVEPSLIHLVGHSLGAQIISFAGKTFTNRTGLQVGRVTGLDPAGVCFTEDAPELRLEPGDAAFVDVIHTDPVIGFNEAIGQVDYFPNGAEQQPGCADDACSHARSWLYFAESVTAPAAFLARRCSDWDAFKNNRCEDQLSPMGFASEPGTEGVYFLRTRGESPYGLGRWGLSWKDNDNAGIMNYILSAIVSVLLG